jgi:hypothetical protein
MNEPIEKSKRPPIGALTTVGHVATALGKVIRAMWREEIGTADGSRIANALGVLRQVLETQKLEQLEERLRKLERGNG